MDAVRERLSDTRQHLRRISGRLGQHDVGAEEEVAAVPQGAGQDQGGGFHGVGLLDEGVDPARVPGAWQRVARADIAVGRGGEGRAHAEGDDGPAGRRGGGRGHAGGEGVVVGNVMIGGHHQNDRFGIGARRPKRRGDQGRTGVAATRFDQEMRLRADHRELTPAFLDMSRAGDDQRAPGARNARHPLDGGLEQGALAQQGDEGLGPLRRRHRPQARAGPAAENDRMDSQGAKSLSCQEIDANRDRRLRASPRLYHSGGTGRRPPPLCLVFVSVRRR